MSNPKINGLISLATKAGKIASGEFCTETEVKAGRAKMVIVAEDASGNTKKKFTNMCSFYHVPLSIVSTKEEIGRAMGKELRASLAILDEGFAKGIMKHCELKQAEGDADPTLSGKVNRGEELNE